MFINTFNVFFPHAIIVLSCKFPILQLPFLYIIRCNSNRIIYNVTISSSFQLPSQFPSPTPANSTFYSPLHYFPSVSDRWFGEGVRLFFFLFLAHSIYSSYLCRRETISNDISSERSTAKNYRILCIFLHFIFGQSK